MVYFIISGKNLQIVTNKNQQAITFPPELIKYQEIIDKKTFEKSISDFFSHSKRNEAGIFLDPSLIYSKLISTENFSFQDLQAQEENFLSNVPIHPAERANLIIKNKSEILFLSCNKYIFTTITRILSEKDWKVKFIVPLNIFSENTQANNINYHVLKKFEKQKKLINKFNFLQNLNNNEGLKENKVVNKKMIFLISIMLLCFTILGLTIFFTTKNSSQTTTTAPTVTPKITITSPSPTLVITPTITLSKSEIKIQILNGSGSPGEATNTQNALTNLGFNNIEIGDAEGAQSNSTIVIFSARTPQTYRDEILTELKKTFSNINTQEIITSNSYDVFITTGENL